jgi:hypothetical protein
MLGVSRDRRFFVGLDVGAIELARTLRDKECQPPRASRRFGSRAAVTRPQVSEAEPTDLRRFARIDPAHDGRTRRS